jgi:hypothetical protein
MLTNWRPPERAVSEIPSSARTRSMTSRLYSEEFENGMGINYVSDEGMYMKIDECCISSATILV